MVTPLESQESKVSAAPCASVRLSMSTRLWLRLFMSQPTCRRSASTQMLVAKKPTRAARSRLESIIILLLQMVPHGSGTTARYISYQSQSLLGKQKKWTLRSTGSDQALRKTSQYRSGQSRHSWQCQKPVEKSPLTGMWTISELNRSY
jgi:hypothetical protein